MPLRDSIAEGVVYAFSFAFMWYHSSVAEIPLLLHRGIRTQEGYRTQSLHVETPKNKCLEILGSR